MRERLLRFVDVLRAEGIAASVSESMTALEAVAVVGVDRSSLREALAASLVKDREDRPRFDAAFERFFRAPRRVPERGGPKRRAASGEGGGRGDSGAGLQPTPRPPHELESAPPHHPRELPEFRPPVSTSANGGTQEGSAEAENEPGHRLDRRGLLELPFRDMMPDDVEACADLVEQLSRRFRRRLSRRQRRRKRGRVDLRRTIHRAAGRGGVPLEILHRGRRPGRSHLVALVDLSHSTAAASGFLLSLLVPAGRFFRGVHLCGYVADVAGISLEGGEVVPDGPLDLHARSDFGRVLGGFAEAHGQTIGRDTVLLVLGDARNNRRPPRADRLRRLAARAAAVVWLVPEPPERWNTGDSVIDAYAPHVDLLLPAWNLRALHRALEQLTRTTVPR